MDYMKEAIKEALKAAKKKEVPVGAVIVLNDKIIARAYNRKEKTNYSFAHAEIIAIKKSSKKLGWRLENATMYVTLEPCPMCAGAIIQSRIKNLYFGAHDLKTGACGSVLNLFEHDFNHKVNVSGGIYEKEISEIISSFFKTIRQP